MRALLNGLGWTSTEPIARRRLREMLEADSRSATSERDQPVVKATPVAPIEQSQSLAPHTPRGQYVEHSPTLVTAHRRR